MVNHKEHSAFKLIKYSPDWAGQWDRFVAQCPAGTMLHTRKFLSYHGERFQDESVIVVDSGDNILAVFPAAPVADQKKTISSHPGATYGGIVQSGALLGEDLVDLVGALKGYYLDLGFSSLLYKPVPFFYHKVVFQDDLYSLFRNKFHLYRRDLLATTELSAEANTLNSKKRAKIRNLVNKNQKNGVCIDRSDVYLGDFWSILSQNLKVKYNTKPVHTHDEIIELMARFPDEIKFIGAVRNGELLAGGLFFRVNECLHAQYLCNSEDGKKLSSLDFVINSAVDMAHSDGMRYFDFGSNCEDDGCQLNQDLYFSKTKHGALGTVQDFYIVEL